MARPLPISTIALGLMLTVSGGCSNPNDDFSGRWESTRVDASGQAIPYEGVIQGVPQLALGHYGPELAGIVYYGVAGGSQFQEPCPCAFVDHLRTDSEEGTLEFESRCAESPTAYWRLTRRQDPLDGEIYMDGTVGRADGQGDPQQVSFRLDTRNVVQSARRCPP